MNIFSIVDYLSVHVTEAVAKTHVRYKLSGLCSRETNENLLLIALLRLFFINFIRIFFQIPIVIRRKLDYSEDPKY